MEWLLGSFDRFLVKGHNFDSYKKENDGKWIIIYYNYDNLFDKSLYAGLLLNKDPNQDGSGTRGNQPIQCCFFDWKYYIQIINIIVYKNKDQFKKIVSEVLITSFNPKISISNVN